MKTQRPVPNRKKPVQPAQQPSPEEMVPVSVLAGLINNCLVNINAACAKVSSENESTLDDAALHCRYYMDGARQLGMTILDAMPPVLIDRLLKLIASYTNSLDEKAQEIATECNVDPGYVTSYLNGTHKMADLIMIAITKQPEAAPADAQEEEGAESK